MPETLEERTVSSDRKLERIFRKRDASQAILGVVHKILRMDEEYAKLHDDQILLITHEGALVYSKLEEADEFFGRLSPEAQKKVMKQKMPGNVEGENYALILNPQAKWFKSGDEMRTYVEGLSEAVKESAFHRTYNRPEKVLSS